MKKLTQASSFISVIALLFSASGSINASELTTSGNSAKASKQMFQNGVSEVLICFKNALVSNSTKSLDSILDKNGFSVIRNFTSGSFGGRGNNIRNFYPAPISPSFKSLVFPVPGETPIKLSSMFHDYKKLNFDSVSVFNDSILGFEFQDAVKMIKPSTSKVIENILNLATKHGGESAPYISVINHRYVVLAEGEITDKICTGYYAIFALTEKTCSLRAVIDLR